MNILGPIKKFLNTREWLRLSNEKYRFHQYFALYTILFSIVCYLVFCWYFLANRTFIWVQDGWTQHYKALVYYARYMRSIIQELLYNHRFVLPEWDFALGEGNDILQSLHYYVIGDPFAVFAFFVPTRFLWIYYDFMILLRLYLSGIAFSCLCFYTRKNISRYAVMAGALSYVFCFWAIYNTNRHPYFLNPMLYFPLILLGIEKILQKRKPYLLIISVFFATISNLYYFYVIVLMTITYVAVRLIEKYKTDFKSLFGMLLRIAGGAILGTMMGGIILVPVAFAFLNDTRIASGNAWQLLYPLSYYSKLLGAFFSGAGDYWLCMGYAAPVILAVFLLFMRKKQHRLLKICFLICSIIILVPTLGQLLNGMSYMSNKWCWAFALLCAYIFTVMWPDLMNLKLEDATKLALTLSICFLGLLMLEYSRTAAAFSCIGIAFIFLFAIYPPPSTQNEILWKNRKQTVALILVITSIVNVSFFQNSAATGHYAEEGKDTEDVVKQLMLTESKAVDIVAEVDGADSFYRYSGRGLPLNNGLLNHMSNTSYYWSISNPAVNLFRSTMELREASAFQYEGYDDRAALITLSSVRYYIVPYSDHAPIPYGFTYRGTINVRENITNEVKEFLSNEMGTEDLSEAQIRIIENATASYYKVYRNDNTLPLTYTYDTVIAEDTWSGLSAVEKQEAMLQSVLLSNYDGKSQDNEIKYSSHKLDYTIECDNTRVTLEDYGFVVTAPNSSVTINMEGLANSETYFSIKGLNFDGASNYDLYFGNEKYDPLNLFTKTRWNLLSHANREAAKRNQLFREKTTGATLTLDTSTDVSKQLNYYTENYTWYNDRHDFTVNLDYSEDPMMSINVVFSTVGVYSFDSIEIICQPMDNYVKQVAALKETVLENVQIDTNTISGTISLDEPQILCISVPYSIGWTAYVDGKKTKLYQANIKNMALALDAGEHVIRLIYRTPFLRLGVCVSIVGFLGVGMLMIGYACKKRKK